MARFFGEVRTQWLREGGPDRRMQLLENFAFEDDNGLRWEAPQDSIIDGASIPEFLWSAAVGTPYVGDYRRATVLHDVACQEMSKPHKDVHRMFYDAMVTDGVAEAKAQQMYGAVRIFGPKWTVGATGMAEALVVDTDEATMDIDELEAALDAALGE